MGNFGMKCRPCCTAISWFEIKTFAEWYVYFIQRMFGCIFRLTEYTPAYDNSESFILKAQSMKFCCFKKIDIREESAETCEFYAYQRGKCCNCLVKLETGALGNETYNEQITEEEIQAVIDRCEAEKAATLFAKQNVKMAMPIELSAQDDLDELESNDQNDDTLMLNTDTMEEATQIDWQRNKVADDITAMVALPLMALMTALTCWSCRKCNK